MTKLLQDRASIIIICPNWPSQNWFPRLLSLLQDYPRLIPKKYKLYLPWDLSINHPLEKTLQLLALKISGNITDHSDFLKALPACTQDQLEKRLESSKTNIQKWNDFAAQRQINSSSATLSDLIRLFCFDLYSFKLQCTYPHENKIAL